jgi:hypothetical protein
MLIDSDEKTPEPAKYFTGVAISKSYLSTKEWYTPPNHPSGHQLSMLSIKQNIVHNIQIL